MKKFVAIYYAPAEAMAQMANITPEQAAKGMEPWLKWREKCGNSIVDFGTPLVAGQSVNASGSWAGSTKQVSGYSILQGENADDVKALFEGHPHLSWAPGCEIEIHECAAM